MTAPATPEELRDRLQQIEEDAARDAVGPLEAGLLALLAAGLVTAVLAAVAWLVVVDRIRALFAGAPERAEERIRAARREAYALSWRFATDRGDRRLGNEVILAPAGVPDRTNLGVADAIREQQAKAEVVLRSNDDLTAGVTIAKRAATRTRAAAAWHVMEAAAEATEAVARELWLPRRWHAEPDACDECKALDGMVVGPFESFPVVDRPPVHPWCRCLQLVERS